MDAPNTSHISENKIMDVSEKFNDHSRGKHNKTSNNKSTSRFHDNQNSIHLKRKRSDSMGPSKKFVKTEPKWNVPWKGQKASKTPSGKPDWNEFKHQKKELKEKRKELDNSSFGVYKRIKCIWEKLRRHDCSESDKIKFCDDIMKLLDGKIMNVIRTHDMARVVQSLIKFGSAEVKDKIGKELMDSLIILACSKYSVHTVEVLFKQSSPDMRKRMISKLSGSVLKLLRNKVSFQLVDQMYVKYGTVDEKKKLKNEFYGNLLNTENSAMLIEVEDGDDTKKAVLSRTKTILSKLAEKAYCLKSKLVQSVLFDYLMSCSESDRKEMLSDLKTFLELLLESREGAMIAGLVLRESSAKEKKDFVKNMKNRPLSDCHSLVLMTLFDTVDDTVLLKKALLPIIVKNAEDLVKNDHGRKVILYLVAHRDTKYFHPNDIGWLRKSEESSFAKKDPEIRIREIQEAVLVPLVTKVQENPKFWLGHKSICMVTLAILKIAPDESLKPVHSAISSYICKETIDKNDFPNIIEFPGVDTFLRQLIVHEKSQEKTSYLADHLLDDLNAQVVTEWISTNRGRFILVKLIESRPEVAKRIFKSLDKEVDFSMLQSEDGPGAQCLYNALKNYKIVG